MTITCIIIYIYIIKQWNILYRVIKLKSYKYTKKYWKMMLEAIRTTVNSTGGFNSIGKS